MGGATAELRLGDTFPARMHTLIAVDSGLDFSYICNYWTLVFRDTPDCENGEANTASNFW